MKKHDYKHGLEDIMFCAFRYALGRRTYVVSMVSDYIISNVGLLDRYTKEKMVFEINEAIVMGDAGMDVDVVQWKKLRAALIC